ncbi:MAG TPA: ABC transporter ATP-binding protein [Alphaproteobacteria bacterium]|nr:ABC transporter ATP-binding protein [Alphaproteobacteria bacterium]
MNDPEQASLLEPMSGTGARVLALRAVERAFLQGGARLEVLRGVSLAVNKGEMVALVGQSGSGKSTLLQIAGLLERPDTGHVIIDGRDCGRLGDDERTRVRRNALGFIYQYHHLLPEFSALENVIVPQMIAGHTKRNARNRALELLGALGLSGRTSHRPARLSGGEQQRVAIARAVANAPKLLLADEPTGNLDHDTADNVFAQLRKLIQVAGIGALVATHNLELAGRMDRILTLENGVVVQR